MAKGGGRRERHTTSPGGDGELLLLGEADCNGIITLSIYLSGLLSAWLFCLLLFVLLWEGACRA